MFQTLKNKINEDATLLSVEEELLAFVEAQEPLEEVIEDITVEDVIEAEELDENNEDLTDDELYLDDDDDDQDDDGEIDLLGEDILDSIIIGEDVNIEDDDETKIIEESEKLEGTFDTLFNLSEDEDESIVKAIELHDVEDKEDLDKDDILLDEILEEDNDVLDSILEADEEDLSSFIEEFEAEEEDKEILAVIDPSLIEDDDEDDDFILENFDLDVE